MAETDRPPVMPLVQARFDIACAMVLFFVARAETAVRR